MLFPFLYNHKAFFDYYLLHIICTHWSDWITCATGLHSRGCDVYVNTTILKTHMDLLIKESLCRLEQKKDFLDSLMSPRGNGVDIEQSEDYTEYASLPGKESFGSSKSDDGTLSSGGDVAVKPIVEVRWNDISSQVL